MRIFDRKFGADFLAGVPHEPGIYRIYDAAGYAYYIYTGQPEPALTAEDAPWVRALIPTTPPSA